MRENSFESNHIIKRNTRDALSYEYHKHMMALQMSKETSLFCIPEITEYNSVKNYLKIELIEGAKSLRELESLSEYQIKQIASILKFIHQKLRRNAEQNDKFQSKDLIHGDFNYENILVDKNDTIYVIDWNLSHHLNENNDLIHRYFDVFWFVSYPFWEKSKLKFWHNRKIVHSSFKFLQSYLHQPMNKNESKDLMNYMEKFFHVQLQRKKNDRRLIQYLQYYVAVGRIRMFKRCVEHYL